MDRNQPPPPLQQQHQRSPPPPPLPHHPSPPTFSEKDLPSVKSNYHTIEDEKSIRYKTCRFIAEAGRILNLSNLAKSTAMVFFHRFYAVHSFEDHDRFEVAVACILLAAKTEENPKKLTTIIQECHKLKCQSANKSGGQIQVLDGDSKEFIRLKERTLLLERVILHTIGFELSIDHPHTFVVDQVKKLVSADLIEFTPESNESSLNMNSNDVKAKMVNLLRPNAINFANDSMLTCLCLQFSSKKIASAVIYMSAQASKMRPTKGRTWLEIFELLNSDDDNDEEDGLDLESLVSIVKQIMELIANRKGLDRSVLFKDIDADLKAMKQNNSGGHTGTGDGGIRDSKRQRISK